MKLVTHLVTCLAAASPLAAQSIPVGGGANEASSTDLGGGTPGFAGEPQIGLIGSPVIGRPLSLVVKNGRPGAFFAIGVSAPSTPVPLPQFGAVVHAMAPFAPFAMSTLDASGESAPLFTVAAVDAALTGVPFTTQALVADDAALGGIAFTDALGMRFGIDDGRPWFHAPSVVLPYPPTGTTSGDFNGDGVLDAAAIYGTLSSSVAILPGLGNGCLGPPLAPVVLGFGGSLGFMSIDAGDIDGDGDSDLVVSQHISAAQFVIKGNGDGTLQAPVVISNVPWVFDIDLTDLNADGRSDLILATISRVTVRQADGLGGFGAATVVLDLPANTERLAAEIVDVDGDNHLDVVVATVSGVHIALGDGAGNFGPAQLSGSSERVGDVVAGFIDGDTHVDLVALIGNPPRLEARLGNGAGAFTTVPGVPAEQYDTALALADVDGDGSTDVVVSAENLMQNSRLFRGDGSGAFDPTWSVLTHTTWFRTEVADFDGDGDADLLGASSPSLVSLLTEGRGSVNDGVRSDLGIRLETLELADLDADGELDVVAFSSLGSQLVWALNIGGGRFGAPTTIASQGDQYGILVLGDQDGDGNVDAFGSDIASNAIVMHRGLPGGGFAGAVLVNTDRPTYYIELADANGDGILDLITASPAGQDLTLVLGLSGGGFSAPRHFSSSSTFSVPIVGDIDADGDVDVVVPSAVASEVLLLANNGNGNFSQSGTVSLPAGKASNGELADIDGDGSIDLLLVVDSGPQRLRVHRGNGAGGFDAGTAFGVGDAFDFSRADVDGDGNDDLVLSVRLSNAPAGATGHGVDIWRGDGLGGFTPGQTFANMSYLGRVHVADVDGDGFEDLVTVDEPYPRRTVSVRPNQLTK